MTMRINGGLAWYCWVAAGMLLAVSSQVNGQECPGGWQDVALRFLRAELHEDATAAAALVVPEERAVWAEWKSWEWERLARRLAAMAEPVQQRAVAEKEKALAMLDVAHCSCQAVGDHAPNRYRVQVDPDGRSYRSVNMVMQEGDWWVYTAARRLDAEQQRVVTAYTKAMDEGRWEEAEAWVARQALPRFAGYRAEVTAFLLGSSVYAEARKRQAELRAEEWEEMMLRAAVDEEGILVVYVEFPNAQEVSCELLEVDGAWRIMHR